MVGLRGGASMKTGASVTLNLGAAAAATTWGAVPMAPADPILGITEMFKKDSRPEKALLGVGAYRDDAGQPYILDCVKKAEERILANEMDHEYASIDGIPSYREKCIKLGWGEDCTAVKEGRVFACQAISGTGSLRVGLDFLRLWFPNRDAKVYVSDPTWGNHKQIAAKAGFEAHTYRYYDRANRCFDSAGMLADLEKADNESIFIFHACAHNPTGCDPTKE
jgi:aspartate aminotransferase, mitochondrial